MNEVFEVNFDGLVGPTHNYSGLSLDNLAATSSKGNVSRPREAALQGLEKMKMLADLGIKQAIIPPQERPYLPLLKNLGFEGTDNEILDKAYNLSPEMLSCAFSAANMWTANAGTFTPSCDSTDSKLHFTPANLVTELHRSVESEHTYKFFKTILGNQFFSYIHKPLLKTGTLGDEGAANHTRLCPAHGKQGLHLFVYGRSAFQKTIVRAQNFIPRQTLEASQTIARTHKLTEQQCMFLQQNPEAIDAGVFHNDVISVGNEGVFFCHEKAFVNQKEALGMLKQIYRARYMEDLEIIEVSNDRVNLQEAVQTYLFNSQLVTLPDGSMLFLAPSDCNNSPRVKSFLNELPTLSNKIKEVRTVNLKQSMKNGGGPACLRLRMVLDKEQIDSITNNIFLNDKLYGQLKKWIRKHYRDSLAPDDLRDPNLIKESRTALEELGNILNIESLYNLAQ